MCMNDRDIIRALGGPSQVARLIGLDPQKGGVQRVANWQTRGIPAAVKLAHPELFLAYYLKQRQDAQQLQGRND